MAVCDLATLHDMGTECNLWHTAAGLFTYRINKQIMHVDEDLHSFALTERSYAYIATSQPFLSTLELLCGH